MVFSDICIITDNVPALVDFYEVIFNTKADGDSTHSTINIAGLGLVIYDRKDAETMMGFDFSDSGNGLITINFNVDDVDAEYTRIKDLNIQGLTEPIVWPWGAKSFRFCDIDGNIILFRSLPE